nr:TonB family protein [uncultured Brumimicrobium sp.]
MRLVLLFFFILPFLLFSQEEDTAIVLWSNYPEASFAGGSEEMNKYIKENFQFPKSLTSESPYGRAFVEITVDTDGSIKNPKILKGISEELDEELLRVVKNMPNWIPAENKDGKAKSIVRFPVNFRLY